MTGVTVTFAYEGRFDRLRITEIAKQARGMFEGMPDLRLKAFTIDDKHQRAMNFYLWESKEAAEGFFTDELREKVTGLYGVRPTIDFVEVAELVDNGRP
jgi:hypothetical protein